MLVLRQGKQPQKNDAVPSRKLECFILPVSHFGQFVPSTNQSERNDSTGLFL